MTRKMLCVAAAVLGVGAVWTGLASWGRTADKAEKAAPYVHTVIFHLKKDAPEAEADALIADAHEMLRLIPSVRDLRAGKPAEKATPDLAKKDYQVGLLVLFDDADGLEAYLKHPMHLKYVEKHGKHLDRDKLVVYDFVDSRK